LLTHALAQTDEMRIERIGNFGSASDRVQSIAEVEPAAGVRVEEGASAHQVAPAAQASGFGIPQRKCVVSNELRYSFFAPQTPSAQD
jgi:hypothetical protein